MKNESTNEAKNEGSNEATKHATRGSTIRTADRFFSGFGTGLLAPIRGMELIFANQRIRHAAILPFILVLLTFLLGVAFGLPTLFHWVPLTVQTALELVGMQSTTLWYWLLLVFAWPVAIFGLLFFLFLVSQLLAAPFYSILAERALVAQGLLKDQPFNLSAWVQLSLRLLLSAVMKLVIFLFIGVLLVGLSLIPGLGLVAAIGFLIMTAFDVVDISLEAQQLGLSERFRYFRNEFPSFLGLAAAMGLVFLLPGLNFFLFPAAVVGGSTIIARRAGRHVPK